LGFAQTHLWHFYKSVCKQWLNVCFTGCLPWEYGEFWADSHHSL
jgi:hypothetical protein